MTGLYEREELFPYLEGLIKQNRQFTLGLIDLNNFKKINDRYGHVFGDKVLKYVASTIRLTFAGKGMVFRYGGDEFIAVFPDQDKKYAYILFKYCNRNLNKRPFLFGSKLLKITVSYGIASYPDDALDVKSLINIADKAMYFSKKRGKGAITDISRIWVLRAGIWARRTVLLIAFLGVAIFIYRNWQKVRITKIATKVLPKLEETTGVESGENFSSYSVVLVLRNGAVLKGRLLHKDEESLTVLVKMDGLEGQMRIEKSLIRKYRLYKVRKY